MNRNLFVKFLVVVFVCAWAVYEMTPPTTRNITEVFQEQARLRDANFSNIVQVAKAKDKDFPERAYGNLRDAVGTNDLTRFFPQFPVKGEKDSNPAVLNHLQKLAAGQIKLGIDLRGGTSFLVAMQTNTIAHEDARQTALANAVEVLRKRVDRLGVAEPIIQPAGDDRILIQLPGLSEAENETARRSIQRAAFLEFRIVHPESERLLAEGMVEPGYEILREQRKGPNGEKEVVPYLVNKKAERGLTGAYIKSAFVNRHPVTGEPEIDFELTSDGATLFAEITREWSPKGNKYFQLAIVLDGELYSAPRIMGPIEGGRGQITGRFDLQEAFELANVLENPLEAPVKIIYESRVDPTLGHDSIRSGITASLIAAACTFAFMFIFYFFVGFVANFALALNVLILMGFMCSIDSTLTLPGIAGIALTIGMAVDANVLIYERMREELAAGKSLRGAIVAGYDKAFGTIFDSNFTTLISSVILIWMGTGPVKGFGITLSIGLCISMFTALFVTRLIFDFLHQKNLIKSIKMMPVVKATKIDFLRYAKLAFVGSWALILLGVGYGFYKGNQVFGVEFTGGDQLTFGFSKKVEVDQIRKVTDSLNVGDAMIQYQRDLSGGAETLRVTTRDLGKESEGASAKVEKALVETFKDAKFQVIGREQVGAVVGKEIQRSAIVASALAMFGILVYVAFRYELSFAVGAVVALLHDVLLTLGIYILVGREFNGVLVAAILTIIGYSINDKIVILDRIREDLKLGVRGSFKDLINIALNQTLSRTMITGGSVILATIALLVFGGGAIKDFAVAFLTGTIVGTFSSIFIASPIVLWWNKGERPKTGSQVTTTEVDSATAKA